MTNKDRTLKRQQLYNEYDGHCGYCGTIVSYEDMRVSTLYDTKTICSCRDCCNGRALSKDLEAFRERLKEHITNLKSSATGKLMVKYLDIKIDIPEKILFHFEKLQTNKVYLHELSIGERMILISKELSRKDLEYLYLKPEWCKNIVLCDTLMNLKIYDIKDCKNCKMIKQ